MAMLCFPCLALPRGAGWVGYVVLMAVELPIRPDPLTAAQRFAIVASRYNEVYVDGMIHGLIEELTVIAPGSEISLLRVPGAFEIPLAVQAVARTGAVDAVFAFGVIWEGKTKHADLIAGSVTDALMRIGLECEVPVLNEVLVVQNADQAAERCLPEGLLNRGKEAGRAAVRMLRMLDELREGI